MLLTAVVICTASLYQRPNLRFKMDAEVKALEQSLPLSRKKKILTTAAILFGNIGLGCSITALAPALEKIRSKYDTTIEDISIVFTVVLGVYCIGAFSCGFISKFVNRQLLVICSWIGQSLALYMVPHCPTKISFFIVGGVLGFSCGFYDSLQIVWIIEIWQDKAGPFILAQHFCIAIGFNIPSLIIARFLSVSESRIDIPYTILGGFSSTALAVQILLFVFYRYHSPPLYANETCQQDDYAENTASQIESEDASNENQKNFQIFGISARKLKLILITGLYLGAYQGMEVCTMQFIPIFGQYSNLSMTQSASDYVLAGLTGMFTIGRAIGIIIIFKVRPELIICVNLFFVTVANLMLLIWADDNLTIFWIASIFLGGGYSTMFPAFCAFMEKHLVFTNAVGAFIISLGTVVGAVYPLIVGKIIEENAVVLTYTNFASTICCVIAMICGYRMTRKCKARER